MQYFARAEKPMGLEVAAVGTDTKCFGKGLKRQDIKGRIKTIQAMILLNSDTIIRRVLEA